jgi:NTP pyrophosphatase (non-canonical NTP hydrolase)
MENKIQLPDLMKELLKFRNDRDWEQFHKPKEVAMAAAIEASELMQEFLWKSEKEVEEFIKTDKEKIADEIADIAAYIFLLAHDLDIDLFQAMLNKMKKNAQKYPIEKCKGKADKYNQL